jgi:hypothetical protein
MTEALDDQEKAVESLQAIVGDLINALEPMLRPADPETKPDLTEAMPNWSPAVGRIRAAERRMNRINQMVVGVLERLDA